MKPRRRRGVRRTSAWLVSCVVFLVIILPRAIAFYPYPHPIVRAIVFFVLTTMISLLVSAMLDQIKRGRAARAQLVDLHDELAESLGRLQDDPAPMSGPRNRMPLGTAVFRQRMA